MTYKWQVKKKTQNDLIEQLLENRGIKTPKQKKEFLNPSLEDFRKELSIPNIDKAIKRIKRAIEDKEQIIVYGDYDVDGISASAILYKGLTSLGAKVLPYLPHREKEGYGLSNVGLDWARDSGATLVITVDNGIVAFEQAKFAKSLGLDLIITDHHLLEGKELPEALTIVHSTVMCGAAVAWCLIQEQISKKLREELLQFAAIATVCDMMPLIGVNRAILVEGLKVLRKTDNLGLLELFRVSGIEKKDVGSYEIGHIIGPRLNAIGRLEHAIDALRLLCTSSTPKARNLAKLLHDANIKRQDFTTIAVDEALITVKENSDKSIHIVHSENFLPGIIGLVAARICQETGRPAIAISVGEGIAKGSARSITGINIAEIIRECSELLTAVGGHKGAAGFSLLPENIPVFIEKMESLIVELPETEPVLEIDAELSPHEMKKNLVKDLEVLAPFGFGNPEPLFLSRNLLVSDIRTVGSGKHLKLTCYVKSNMTSHPELDVLRKQKASFAYSGSKIDIIAFGKGEMEKLISNGAVIDVVYNLEINKFNGNETLQLKAKDLKISNSE